jgi:hypothetical protein
MPNFILVDDNRYVSTDGYDGSVLVQAGHGYLYQVTAINLLSSTRFMQVFDSLTAPAANAIPFACLEVPASSEATMRKELPLFRWVISNGIYIVSSTTAGKYTAGGAQDLFLQVYFTQ